MKCRRVKLESNHINHMLMTLRSRASNGVRLGEKAAKPMTPVQDCVPTFVRVNIKIYLRRHWNTFQLRLWPQKLDIFYGKSRNVELHCKEMLSLRYHTVEIVILATGLVSERLAK